MELNEAFQILRSCGDRRSLMMRLLNPETAPSADQVDDAYKAMASASPETVMPVLANLVWNAHQPLRSKLESRFMEIATRLPVPLWPVMDENIRRQFWYGADPSINFPNTRLPESAARLIIALCHPSGRIREKGVRHAGGLNPAFAAPLLLIRVNDWAAPVRSAAVAKLTTVLQALSFEEKLALVPVLTRIRECGRHGQHAMLDGWRKILATPFDEPAWLAAWLAATGKNKCGYLELLKVSGHAPGADTRRSLLASNDRLALFWLIREILPTMAASERDDVILALRKSRAVPVKREWLSICLETRPVEETEQLLIESLTDPSRSIRQFARFHLAKISPIDFNDLYQTALRRPESEAVALTALAEVSPDDAHREALLRLDSKIPAVLKAAVGAIHPQSLSQHLDFLLDAVGSDLAGVSKIARKRLSEICRNVGSELIARPGLWSQFPMITKSHMIRMAPDFQKWDGFEFLLHRIRDENLRGAALIALHAWEKKEGRSFSRLAPARKEKLMTSVEESGLPHHYSESLRFMLARA